MRNRRQKKRILRRINFIITIVIILCTIQILSNKYNRSIESKRVQAIKEKETISENNKQQTIKKKETNSKNNKQQALKQSLLLVNRDNKLDEHYLPNDLTVPNIRFLGNSNLEVRRLRRVASGALENLFQEAKNENIILLGVSGYRNYHYQVNVYNNSVYRNGQQHADKYVAQPGTSEHQTGLAMDIVSTEYTNLDENFVNTRAYKWLKENCYKYGFIIRYPKEKEDITGYNFEPWHIRYVGIEAATEIMNKGITLEEYLQEGNCNK
ncbi:M15 family metallopeptidase [Clostridium botulinum]|uniref:M15 family metallopeptidase n=1 Tax=Clostridium botulinum TaxID=1491 RepID=UPI0007742B07|nr:M15 family metallopeptidase [Clostridium botulinum]APQ78080.1 D-alanyl-D-alanine carboxypeptidase family protein [Clostridium botulinum]AUM98512.1 D-alanyl-D-alanine carboxypeptidase [Clostridium botulinum]KEI80414.1 D-alanyl-D-alanine carboxypeptidase [Clostridium botulinum B2 331]KEI86453.1 D-alanyl-D-alanine carboxypeptidase [Clostridium botulinum B2 267]MBN3352884.1 D-alanyl-D-alanine carboxypeptidase [Clostridium botulinum]